MQIRVQNKFLRNEFKILVSTKKVYTIPFNQAIAYNPEINYIKRQGLICSINYAKKEGWTDYSILSKFEINDLFISQFSKI